MNSQFKPDTWAGKIYSLGQKVFENSSNKEIAALVNCDNHGIVSRERKTVSDKTGWTMPVGRQSAQETNTAQPIQSAKPRKSGSLPEKIQGYLVSAVDEIPETWKPENVFPVIDEDSVAWNRFIRRLHDIDSAMIESFEKWLGRGATLSRQGEFDAASEAAAQWDLKAQAIVLAEYLVAMGFGDKSPKALLREIWL